MRRYFFNTQGISLLLVLFLVGLGTGLANAQDGWGDTDSDPWGDSGSDPWGEETTDSLNSDSSGDNGWGGSDGWGGDDGGFGENDREKEEPTVKREPYVRFVPPYDSTYELVTYEDVVEVLYRDGFEVEIDTIRYRAKQWLEEEFGKRDLKQFLQSDGQNVNSSEFEYKIVLVGTFPCIVKPNEFTEFQNGNIEFRMEIRIREGRYRYKIDNLVHIAPVRAHETEGIATYFEYLMKSENNIRGNDVILKSADRKINEMMDELAKQCRSEPIYEVDDW